MQSRGFLFVFILREFEERRALGLGVVGGEGRRPVGANIKGGGVATRRFLFPSLR